jgi:hypothetical protein
MANLSKDEYFIKDLVDMLFYFILQVVKKDGYLYPPMKYVFFACFVFHVVVYFFQICFRV